ncbi:MAG: hypothetical protein MI700_08530 [Balneolales bacterium]|nr:hypothetical protein [Balneolales bacterium]
MLTALLVSACILSGIMLAATPPPENQFVKTEAELDSLILETLEISGLKNNYRVSSIELDSILTRKTYRIDTNPGFSKTSFHIELKKKLYPYNIEVPARVVFPEEDMNIYVVHEGTVFRTLRLATKEDTDG